MSTILPAFTAIHLFIQSVLKNRVAFLVFHNGRITWGMLRSDFVEFVREILSILPPANRHHEVDWNEVCRVFQQRIPRLPFLIDGYVELEWKQVIFENRNLMIRLPNGQIVPAKYIEYFGEMMCDNSQNIDHHISCQIRGTDERVIIPIGDIVTHLPSKKNLEDYDQKLAEKKAEEKAAIDAKAAAEASEAYRQQMMDRGSIVGHLEIQRYYPLFSIGSLQALFQICKKFGIVPDFTYEFNLIVDRFQKLVDHSSFAIQQLSEDDQKAFDAFSTKYMNEIVGRVIRSKTARFKQSKLPVYLFRVFEYYCYLFQINSPTHEDIDEFLKKGDDYFEELATNMTTTSGNPLEFPFPDEYWTRPEFHVLRKPLRNAMFQTLCESPKEMNFPADVFVS
jgi:hypothetical protein